MKKILCLAFAFVFLFGAARADYTKVKTDLFLGMAGADDHESVRNGDLQKLAVLGLLVAYEIAAVKNLKFELNLKSPFLGVGSSRTENRLIYVLENKKNNKFKLAYIDLDSGFLYAEKKDYDINTIMDKYFDPMQTDDSYAYREKDLTEAIASLVVFHK